MQELRFAGPGAILAGAQWKSALNENAVGESLPSKTLCFVVLLPAWRRYC